MFYAFMVRWRFVLGPAEMRDRISVFSGQRRRRRCGTRLNMGQIEARAILTKIMMKYGFGHHIDM